MAETPTTGNGLISWRVGKLEDLYKILDDRKADAKDVVALMEEVRSLRKSIYTLAFGSIGSALVFAFTVFQLLAR